MLTEYRVAKGRSWSTFRACFSGINHDTSFRLVSLGAVRRPIRGTTPEIEATFIKVCNFSPTRESIRAAINDGIQRQWLPVTYLGYFRLQDYYLLDRHGKRSRWSPPYIWRDQPVEITTAYVQPCTMSIVHGRDVVANLSLGSDDVFGEMGWIRANGVIDDNARPGASIIYIPCIEIIRYCYGLSYILRDAFTAGTLFRPSDFRYRHAFFNYLRCRFESDAYIPLNISMAHFPAANYPNYEQDAYVGLNTIARSLVSAAQHTIPDSVEAFPPIHHWKGPGYTLKLQGLVGPRQTKRGEGVYIVYALRSLSQ